MKNENDKKDKNDIRCESCGFVFRGIITEDSKCPKCGATHLHKWSGGLITD